MEKKEIIERTKKAYLLYKENRIYQALKEIYPVAIKVKTEKVQKLYKVLVLKSRQLLTELLNAKEYNKLEEIEYMFFDNIDLPEIKAIFNRVKEERQKLLEEIKKEEQEKDIEDAVTEIFVPETKSNTGKESSAGNENTEFDADNFKLSSFSEDEMGENDVNALIQKGVSLYEVGDFENALIVWKQALELQPDNEFLKDYILSAEKELGMENREQKEKTEPSAELSENLNESIQTEVKDENEPVNIVFDEGKLSGELKRIVAIARSGDTERAKNLLDNLHKNNELDENLYNQTKRYIEKLEKEVGVSIIKNKIKNFVEEKEFEKALEYLEKHKNRLKFDEKNRIEQFILEKKQEHLLSSSLELELEEEKPVKRIKRISKRQKKEKPVYEVKEKKHLSLGPFFKTLFFFVILIGILGTVIFYGVKIIKSNLQTQQENNFNNQEFQEKEEIKKREKMFKKYLKEAKDYFDMGEYLFSYYTYLHAERFGKLDEQEIAMLSKARKLMKEEGFNRKKEMKLAERYLKRKNCEKAIPHLKNILRDNPENLQIKEKLFQCYKETAIKYALENNILKAKSYFKYALVLNRNDDEILKHIKVLDRYLHGQLNKKLLIQWFYFFIK